MITITGTIITIVHFCLFSVQSIWNNSEAQAVAYYIGYFWCYKQESMCNMQHKAVVWKLMEMFGKVKPVGIGRLQSGAKTDFIFSQVTTGSGVWSTLLPEPYLSVVLKKAGWHGPKAHHGVCQKLRPMLKKKSSKKQQSLHNLINYLHFI